MPKIIAPRRTDKNLSVEDYWTIRSEFTKQKQVQYHAYRNQEVDRRYRFARLSDQLLAFNPLLYFLNKKIDPPGFEKTHTHQYLESIHYHLPEDIMEVKYMMFGLASILQHIDKIYSKLWEFHNTEDCWKLLQTLLADTRGESYRLWITTGLPSIVSDLDYNFNETKFRHIFNTLCVFLEVNFPKIVATTSSLAEFLEVMSKHYFSHPNKYLRKFSLKTSSYLLSNIQEHQFTDLLAHITHSTTTQSPLREFLSDLLANRLKYSKGCLTPNSVEELISLIDWVINANVEEKEKSMIQEEFVTKVLANLDIKSGKEQTETLFDFGYIIKALMELVKLNRLEGTAVMKAIVAYLNESLPRGRKRKLTTGLEKSISEFLWVCLPSLPHDEEIYSLIAQGISFPLSSLENITKFLESEQQISLLTNLLRKLHETGPSEHNVSILLFSLRDWVLQYFAEPLSQINQGHIELIYRIVLILKQKKMNINLDQLTRKREDFTEETMSQKMKELNKEIEKEGSKRSFLYEYSLVMLRLLTVLNISGNNEEIQRDLSRLSRNLLSSFTNKINEELGKSNALGDNIFSCARHVEQIFLYSHSEIPVVLQGVNLLESFIQVQKKLSCNIINLDHKSLQNWYQVILNRPFLCLQLKGLLLEHKQMDTENSFISLKSRHRPVRHQVLKNLVEKGVFAEKELILGNTLLQIQNQPIDLDNERDVKRSFLELERFVKENQLSQQTNEILLSWCLGFAFTGFKLIEGSFCSFLSTILQGQQDIDTSDVMRFLEYYTFRNSRIFTAETKEFFKQTDNLRLSESFEELSKMDFRIEQLQTAEFIGVERITTAIAASEKIKKKLGPKLQNLVHVYFSQEFIRHKQVLKSQQCTYLSQSGDVNELLLPPKTTFLKQILKVVPSSYQPPLQCLHYCDQILKMSSIRKTKRQDWELLWEKKIKHEHSRIKFDQMSMEEKQIYLHFLWGHTLRSNANKIRVILEHVRENMPEMLEYYMNIYYEELMLGVVEGEGIRRIFQSMDSRKLLTFIYILKAVMKSLKNYVRDNIHKVHIILQNIIEIFQSKEEHRMIDEGEERKDNEGQQQEQGQGQEQEQEQEDMEADEQGEGQEGQEGEEEGQVRSLAYRKYKNHRREMYKILNAFIEFTADCLDIEVIRQILAVFSSQGKISSLPSAAMNSTPGILIFLKQLSFYWKFHPLFNQFNVVKEISKIINQSISSKSGVISASTTILKNLLGVTEDGEMVEEGMWLDENIDFIKDLSFDLLESFRKFLSGHSKKDSIKPDLLTQIYSIVLKLMQMSRNGVPVEWNDYLWTELQRITKQKNMTESQKNRIFSLLEISMEYSRKMRVASVESANEFLMKMIGIIPHLKDVEHRKLVSSELIRDAEMGNSIIGRDAAEIVTQINTTVPDSLIKQLDFPQFFNGINSYKNGINSLSVQEHEYIIYNTLPYLTNEELSVRKAVNSCIHEFLKFMSEGERELISKLFRAIAEYLRKPIEGGEQIFWSITVSVGHFVRWIVFTDTREYKEHYQIFGKYVRQEENSERDLFELLCALSQSKKLEGLKMLKDMLANAEGQGQIRVKPGDKYPNIIGALVIPILEHFILPQPVAPGTQYVVATNLASSLTHVSLEIYEVAMARGGESVQRKELKRLISKIKFNDMNLKKNLLAVKIIGQIIESIKLPKSTDVVKETIKESGFDEFHKKILEKESNFSKIRDDEEESDEEEEAKRVAFNRINNEIEDDEIININYLTFDKKLLQAEEEAEHKEETEMVRFLKINVLAPLKTMLMFENRSVKNSKEETDKSRMFLSVVVTKIIVKFPLDVFMNELQKVLSKLGRLLKKKQVEVRENSRKCLAEIAKLIGPEMFYMLIRELKFHLRDNFQQHIMNYSIYYILEKIGELPPGALDHCLPLLLAPIVDQIFGRSAAEKEMVDEHSIPTINMESKKRKGYELLVILCRQLSVEKVTYLIQYFEKFLREYMNTEANLSKYDQLLTNLIGGFSRNPHLLHPSNVHTFASILHHSIETLKADIKLYKFEDEPPKHDSTVKQKSEAGKKVNLKKTYELQEEVGRNGSIFKKQARVLQQRRNHDIMTTSFMQLHLSLLGLLIKKKVFADDTIESDGSVEKKFSSILNFVIECVEHRDNRLVHKCLKIIHTVIHWEKLSGMQQVRKKVCRKIFALIEKLTGADEDLLKECFLLLNDLFVQVTVNKEILPTLLTIIKLHIVGNEYGALEEPFKLLKTVLAKISNTPLILEPSILELYELVRITMISTSLDQIRGICRSICLIFMRQESHLIQTNNLSQSKKQAAQQIGLNYQKEVSFYLNNLDCKYSEAQLCILDVLEEYCVCRSKAELEETGEVIIMSLGTACINDNENHIKITRVISLIVKKVDKGKVNTLAEKCLVWMDNDQNQLVSKCGFFLFKNVISNDQITISKNLTDNCVKVCLKTLSSQSEKLQIYYSDKRENMQQRDSLKKNPEWAGIIQQEEINLQIDANIGYCLDILDLLISKIQNKSIIMIVDLLWKLFAAPSEMILKRVASFMLKIKKIVPALGPKLLSQDKSERNSMRKKLQDLMSSLDPQNCSLACEVMKKVIGQLHEHEQFLSNLENWVSTIMIKIGRCVLNIKKFQNQMQVGLELIKVLLTASPESQKSLFSNEKILSDLFWNLSKINRNDLIELHVKEKNEQVLEIIKEFMGESQFYNKLAGTEALRKDKKNVEKIEMARLAITDQAAFEQAKARKKHKKG